MLKCGGEDSDREYPGIKATTTDLLEYKEASQLPQQYIYNLTKQTKLRSSNPSL